MPVVLLRRIKSPARQEMTRSLRNVRRDIRAEMRNHGEDVKGEFEGIVSDWSSKNRPKFTIDEELSSRVIRVTIRPHKRRRASRIFEWVDQGTRPHKISPRRRRPKSLTKERLAFRLDYKPLTRPVAQAHTGDGKKHGGWVMPKTVQHPGVKARLFSQEIKRRTEEKFRRRIESIFRRYARRWR